MMKFEKRMLSEIPENFFQMNGLKVSEKRFPSVDEYETYSCVHDVENNVLFMELKKTSYELRDSCQGYYLLIFGQDPIVIAGLSSASIHLTIFAKKYGESRIAETASKAVSVLYSKPVKVRIKQQGDSNLKNLQARTRFEDLLSKNNIRKRNNLISQICKMFPFLRARQNMLQSTLSSMNDVMEGLIGPQATNQLKMTIKEHDTKVELHIHNDGSLTLNDVEISKESVMDLVAPGFGNNWKFITSGFDYEEFPNKDKIDGAIKLYKLRPNETRVVYRDRIGAFEPKSSIFAVKFSTMSLFGSKVCGYIAFATIK